MVPITILAVEGALILLGLAVVGAHYFGSDRMRSWLHHFYKQSLHIS